jgi:hypothetical protein
LYIGSTSVLRVEKGYRGSVSSYLYKNIWKKEIKENPHLFNVQIISYHDTRPEATYKELQLQKMFNVITNPNFINLAYAAKNGYYGNGQAKSKNDHPMFGKKYSDEARKNMSLSRIGMKFSNIHKENISTSHKGCKWSETQSKNFSNARSGESHYYFGKKRDSTTKEKISKTLRLLTDDQELLVAQMKHKGIHIDDIQKYFFNTENITISTNCLYKICRKINL